MTVPKKEAVQFELDGFLFYAGNHGYLI